jgi:hypothetical protein
MERKVINAGDDQFCVDADGKIYKNGYGLTPVGLFLYYKDGNERKKLLRDKLIALLFQGDLDEKEALRRTRIATGWHGVSKTRKAKRMADANKVNKRAVFCTTERRKFSTMKAAATYYGFSSPSLHQALEEKREIKGLYFKRI